MSGNMQPLSKELVRKYYKDIGYEEELYYARKNDLPEPDIDPLPYYMIQKVSELYKSMFERMTNLSFYH